MSHLGMWKLVAVLSIHAASISAINSVDMSTKSPYWTQLSGTQHPKCEPIYLSTLSRHGSRTASSESKYLMPSNYMREALAGGLLTSEGENVLKWSDELYAKLTRRNISWGGLTDLGKSEQHSIGVNTFKSFAPIFESGKVSVRVDATEVQRTQDSRDAFVQGLVDSGADPSIFDIRSPPTCEASLVMEYAKLRFFDVCSAYSAYAADNPFQQQYDAVSAVYSALPVEEIFALLFAPAFAESKTSEEKLEFVHNFYGYTCATQVDTDMDFSRLCSVISEHSGEHLSYVADLETYIEKGPVEGYPIVTQMSCPFFQSLMDDLNGLDTEGAGGASARETAHLRFAHAETVLPVIAELGLVSENPFIWTGRDVSQREFNGHFISPMATNVMVAVYRCERRGSQGGEFLAAQLLQNGEPRRFPVCTDTYLCPLEDVKAFLATRACGDKDFEDMCGGVQCEDE